MNAASACLLPHPGRESPALAYDGVNVAAEHISPSPVLHASDTSATLMTGRLSGRPAEQTPPSTPPFPSDGEGEKQKKLVMGELIQFFFFGGDECPINRKRVEQS